MLRYNRSLYQIITITIFSVIVASIPLGACTANMFVYSLETSKQYESSAFEKEVFDEDHIIRLLYDSTDEICTKSAQQLEQELHLDDVNIISTAIQSDEELVEQMTANNWINLYIFHGTDQGMHIGPNLMSWNDLVPLIRSSPVQHHLYQVCHSATFAKQFVQHPKYHVYGLPRSVDSQVALLNSYINIYEIIDQSNSKTHKLVAERLLDTVGSYFLNNLNEIFYRAMFPQEPLAYVVDIFEDNTTVRGPWGWFVEAILQNLLAEKINSKIWYDVLTTGTTQLQFDTTKIISGLTDQTDISLAKLGAGNDKTGKYPFDIPLTLDVTPRMGTGPWYMPEYVDLKISIQPKKGGLDLAEVTGLKQVVEAAGYSVELKLSPSLKGTIRIGNFIDEMESANAKVTKNPFSFLGGAFAITFDFEFGIPLPIFLDYVIPGSGTTIAKVLDLLNIKINLLQMLSLKLGMDYNATLDASSQDVTLKAGIGFLIDAKIPSAKSLIKKALGVSLPLDFIKLGAKLKGTTGVLAQANFGHKGSAFKVGLFYTMMFKFWAKLFWFLKFSTTKKWSNDIKVPLIQIAGDPKQDSPPNNDHALLDLDEDGLYDDIESALGTNPNLSDTDGDGLSDGNEIYNYFTDPTKADSDDDEIEDGREYAEYFKLGLNALADYDGDGLPSILDWDADNDGLNDSAEIFGMESSHYMKNIKTNPSLPDTDFDGLTDYEEWDQAGPQRELPHSHPRWYDTDGDGLNDGTEWEWFRADLDINWPVAQLLDNDSDDDLLLDGLEYDYHTHPLDIDTDGDYDLDNDNIINGTEASIIGGNLTDYWEIMGNYWPEWPWGMFDCVPPNPTPTNPLRADSDGDGVSDPNEWLNSTPPVDDDSDGDGLLNIEDRFTFNANCTIPDTDNDGFRDGDEVRYFNLSRGIANETIANFTFLLNPDLDNDGIKDGHELRYGTDPMNNDTDGDGLRDGDELEVGTYPLLPDTDGDGIIDGVEVHDLGTDPRKTDTDNDGLTDFQEIHEQHLYLQNIGDIYFFTDPTDPDTDDDTIIDGEEVLGWNWATKRHVDPGSLVIDEPFSGDGDRILLIQDYYTPDPYRARFQTNPDNADTDSDGLPDGDEKILVLSPLTPDTDSDGWPDVEEIAFMEEKLALPWDSIPYDIWHYLDYDKDGLSDLAEVTNGTSILMPDTDGDGLDDWTELYVPVSYSNASFENFEPDGNVTISTNATAVEYRKYTDPLNPDTDGDGLSDKYEVVNGTDPTNPDTDADGLSDYEEIMVFTYSQVGIDVTQEIHLDPVQEDTDADGIRDGEEVGLFEILELESGNNEYGILGDPDNDNIPNIFDYDSDNDGIYDGLEFDSYTNQRWPWYPIGTDLVDPDQDDNGILDGKQTDYDYDALSDHYELNTIVSGYSAILQGNKNTSYNGYSHLVGHTLGLVEDTDGDTFSDGAEVLTYGTDPLNPDHAPYFVVETVTDYDSPYDIHMVAGSRISDFNFNAQAKQVEFTVEGPDGTTGFCNITIPRDLLDSAENDWTVFLDDESIPYDQITNETVTLLHFTYEHSIHEIVIKGTEIIGEIAQSGYNFGWILFGVISSFAVIVIIRERT